MKTRIFALLLAFFLILVGCSLEEGKVVSPSEDPSIAPSADPTDPPAFSADELKTTVLTVDGDAVSLAELRYQIASLVSAYEYFGDGGVDWSEPIEGVPAGDFFVDEAIETCRLFRAVERYADENGYALSDDELATIDADIAAYADGLGGRDAFLEQLTYAGMTEELYRYLVVVPQLYYKIYGAIYGEGGSDEITDEAVETYFDENYLTARHILLVATDANGGYLSDEKTAEIRENVEELHQKLLDGENFVELATDFSDDDELLGTALTFERSTMPEEYVAAAEALGEGEFSGVVDIDGAFVIVRREPLDRDYLAENREQLREEYGLSLFRVVLDARKERLEVERADGFALIDMDEIYDAFFGE